MLAATPGPPGWGDSLHCDPRPSPHTHPLRPSPPRFGDTAVASRQLHSIDGPLQAKQNHCGGRGLSGWGCGGPGHRQEKRGTYSSAWRGLPAPSSALGREKRTCTNLPTSSSTGCPKELGCCMEGRMPQKRDGPETHAVPTGQEAAA